MSREMGRVALGLRAISNMSRTRLKKGTRKLLS